MRREKTYTSLGARGRRLEFRDYQQSTCLRAGGYKAFWLMAWSQEKLSALVAECEVLASVWTDQNVETELRQEVVPG